MTGSLRILQVQPLLVSCVPSFCSPVVSSLQCSTQSVNVISHKYCSPFCFSLRESGGGDGLQCQYLEPFQYWNFIANSHTITLNFGIFHTNLNLNFYQLLIKDLKPYLLAVVFEFWRFEYFSLFVHIQYSCFFALSLYRDIYLLV